MKKVFLTLIVLISCSSLFGQEQLSLAEFKNLCDSNELSFEMPKGYQITPVKSNPDLGYSFAIKNADSTMEIRYTIWSLKPMLAEYEASLKDSNAIMVPPNNIYKGRIQANMLNMTGGQFTNIGAFPTDAVKREFNADAGGSCFFPFNCKFGEGYKFGQFMYLHKDNVADVIVTFMSNDADKHPDLMLEGFHALKFK